MLFRCCATATAQVHTSDLSNGQLTTSWRWHSFGQCSTTNEVENLPVGFASVTFKKPHNASGDLIPVLPFAWAPH